MLKPEELQKMVGHITDDDLQKRFTYHAPKGDQPARYEMFRRYAMELASDIIRFSPASREQSLALTALEECVMWTNAAIARNE